MYSFEVPVHHKQQISASTSSSSEDDNYLSEHTYHNSSSLLDGGIPVAPLATPGYGSSTCHVDTGRLK